MSLETAIAELESGQSHEEMLTALKARTITSYGMAQSGVTMSYFLNIKKYSELKRLVNTTSHPLNDVSVDLGDAVDRPLKEIADGVLDTILFREGFDFRIPEVQAMAYAFVLSGFMTSEELQGLLAIGSTQIAEFPSVTLKQIVAAREPLLLTPLSKELDPLQDRAGRSHMIFITPVSALPESVNFQVYVSHKAPDNTYTEYVRVDQVVGVQSGTATRRLGGEFITKDTKVKIVSPYNVDFTASVEIM